MNVSQQPGATRTSEIATAAAGMVLLTLASAQFLMTLDSSVMNVSIATVARDVDTTVTGIQTAITFYTLVMASLMITGGKLGQILGRRRAFSIGCVIYGSGSLITALAPNLAVLMAGWSVLEGTGAALIMPAIVALVASNFARDQRPRAYGLVASAAAIAVAAGPLIGGLFTTYLSWRWVFVSEVLVVLVILVLSPRRPGSPAARLLGSRRRGQASCRAAADSSAATLRAHWRTWAASRQSPPCFFAMALAGKPFASGESRPPKVTCPRAPVRSIKALTPLTGGMSPRTAESSSGPLEKKYVGRCRSSAA
ncbi:MAG: MFS transporter [Streptosporangiaceae bacterium]|jgi:MFS family permease